MAGRVQVFDRSDGVKILYVNSRPSMATGRAQRQKSAELRAQGHETRLAIGPRELKLVRSMAPGWE